MRHDDGTRRPGRLSGQLPPLTEAARADEAKKLRIGFQKSGLRTVMREQGTIETRPTPLGVESVRRVEFR